VAGLHGSHFAGVRGDHFAGGRRHFAGGRRHFARGFYGYDYGCPYYPDYTTYNWPYTCTY
jgi:hypothetical protein